MVLAAGLGTRMRPLTLTRPKPLIEVGGKTLFAHCLQTLAKGGVKAGAVNVHYLADEMEAFLAREALPFPLAVSDERTLLLETGGGLVQALPLLGSDPFFSINCDNIWLDTARPAAQQLRAQWDGAQMDGLLLLVPREKARCHPDRGDFLLGADGRLARPVVKGAAPYIYTGLQMLSKRLFAGVVARPFSLNLLWDRAMAEGRLFGVPYDGLWFDVGTPEALPAVEEALRRQEALDGV